MHNLTKNNIIARIDTLLDKRRKSTGANINGNRMGDSSYYRKADALEAEIEDLTERLAHEIITALDSQQAEILRLERFRAQVATAVNHSGIH